MCEPCSSAQPGSSAVSDSKTTTKTFRIPEGSLWASAWKMTLAVALIGTLIALAGAVMQPQRFAFSYLYGFVTALTLWLGTVFFVLIQHLTGAGWSADHGLRLCGHQGRYRGEILSRRAALR